MRFWGAVALRRVKSGVLTPIERMTANEWGSELAVSAKSGLLIPIRNRLLSTVGE